MVLAGNDSFKPKEDFVFTKSNLSIALAITVTLYVLLMPIFTEFKLVTYVLHNDLISAILFFPKSMISC